MSRLWIGGSANKLCAVPTVPGFSRRYSSQLWRSKRDGVRCPACPVAKCRRPLDNDFATHTPPPAVNRTSRHAHSRPFAKLSRRRRAFAKSIAPSSASILAADKHAQLMRLAPSLDHINPRRNGPTPIADRTPWRLRPQLPPRSITSAHRPKDLSATLVAAP